MIRLETLYLKLIAGSHKKVYDNGSATHEIVKVYYYATIASVLQFFFYTS